MADNELTVILEDRLLAEVQVYDCLYNKYSREFKDKYKKINCWEKVAEKCEITSKEAEKKFATMRNDFTRYLRKMKTLPSGSGRKDDPRSKRYKSMEWLIPYIDHRQTVTNVPTRIESNSSNFRSPSVKSSIYFSKSPTPAMSGPEDSDEELVESIPEEVSVLESEKRHDLELDDNSYYADDPVPLLAGGEMATNTESTKNKNEIKRSSTSSAKAKPSSTKTQQNSESTSNCSKRPYAYINKMSTNDEINNMLLTTANSLAKHLKKNADVSPKTPKKSNEDEDGESLFCRSLIPRMKRLPDRMKAYIRLQIEQILFQAEISGMPQPINGPFVSNQSFQFANQPSNVPVSYLSGAPNVIQPEVHHQGLHVPAVYNEKDNSHVRVP